MENWIVLDKNSGIGGTDIVSVNVATNTAEERTYELVFKDPDGRILRTLEITQEATQETADLIFNNSFLTNSFTTPDWEVVSNVNATLNTENGLYCNNTFLQYKNTKGYTWYDFSRITMEFDCKQELLNTSTVKRIVSLAPNQSPDGTGFLYQGNNSCAIVLNNNTPAGWISIYTTEYDWGTFGTWFHVTIEFRPEFMSLTLNNTFTKTFDRPTPDKFKKHNSIYFGALTSGLSQKNKGYIKNFVLKAYI